MGVLGVIAFLVVSILPGAWITFGLPLANVSFSVRFFAAIALSPFVIFLQYCLVSPLGLSFPVTALLLVGVNALALWPVWRRIDCTVMKGWRSLWLYGLVTLVPLACLAPQLVDTQARIYSGHGWMHAAIVSQFSSGNVIPGRTITRGRKTGISVVRTCPSGIPELPAGCSARLELHMDKPAGIGSHFRVKCRNGQGVAAWRELADSGGPVALVRP